jgi:site-specific recombinase XerD
LEKAMAGALAVIENMGAALALPGPAWPAIVARAGGGACFCWEEFLTAGIRNPHTRRAYGHAVRRFLAWAEGQGVELVRITPGLVGQYLDQFEASIPTKKQHLAAIRGFFDRLVIRHVVVLNPAASVKAARYQAIEGKTPEIAVEQARTLLRSIRVSYDTKSGPLPSAIGLRDRAVISILIYTAARIGAVAGLKRGSLAHDGSQWLLRFEEKGGKSREIPVRHDLETTLLAWLDAAGLRNASKDAPLFRSAIGKTGLLSDNAPTAGDLSRMVKRRLKDAGLPERLSPHSFRVATITDLLNQGAALEDVQHLAGHANARTTRLYDRRQKVVSRNLVERISV